MKTRTPVTFLLLFSLALCPNPPGLSGLSQLSLAERALFEKYSKDLKTQGLTRMTPKEREFRFKIFESHLKMISRAEKLTLENLKEENAGAHSYTSGINKFSFLSDDEFEKRFLISTAVMNADSAAQRLSRDPEHSFDYFLEKVLKEVDKTVDAANDSLKLAERLGFDHGFGEGISFENIKRDLKSQMGSGFPAFGSLLTQNSSPGFLHEGDFELDSSGLLGRFLGEKKFLKVQAFVDWRPQFNPIFDQGDCNACYITSSLETIEAIHHKIYPNLPKIRLSVQEVLDCSSQSSGCLGGQPSVVFDYIKRFGVSYHQTYRYLQKKGACRIQKTPIGGRQLQASPAYTGALGSSDLMNQSYMDLIQDIYRISNTPMQRLLDSITPDEVRKNNRIVQHVNGELLKLGLPYSKRLEYDYVRQRFFFVLNKGFQSGDEYQDLYGFPYIPGIILLNDIKQNKGRGPLNPYLPGGTASTQTPPSNSGSQSPQFPTPDSQSEPNPRKSVPDLTPLPSEEKPQSPNPNPPKSFSSSDRYLDLKEFYFIRPNVVELLRALQYGPVIVAHYVPPVFKFYKRGVFDGEGCDNVKVGMVNHAAVVVGYNLRANPPYFRIRSSWGSDWGEGGYYRMKIGEISNKNKGTCLIAGTPFMVFPYLKNFT